jgi:CRISPR-associated endonuclease Cas2
VNRHHWLIVYDICDGDRLKNVAKIVSRYAVRVQRSVFEADISDSTIDNLEARLKSIVTNDDSVFMIPLCTEDCQKIERYGIIQNSPFVNGHFAVL